ncbi:MAG: DUF362 domain-containing protein [Candidatus Heimdallarchaeota archaeon]|nr:DUF362 domain-containing protein [Candidatus Heimdallarchaeota archaeon]
MAKKSNIPKVVLIETILNYPETINPPIQFPEFKNFELHEKLDPENEIYRAIRNAFKLLDFDKKNINTEEWNPLSEMIKPGDTVLLKPNFVLHKSNRKETSKEELITHPSVIFAVLDYVILALRDKGLVILGDAPIQEADFNEIINQLNLDNILKKYKSKTNVKIELLDFRKERSVNRKYREIQRIPLSGDPRGYCTIDLGKNSAFSDISNQSSLFRVTNYDKKKMVNFHNNGHHKYLIANSVLQADVVISLPKLKTHRKAGLTCALKNLIGINGSKDCLPHHRKGSIEEGGDEYLHMSWRKRKYSDILEKRAQIKNSLFGFFLYVLKSFIILTEKIFPYKDPFKEGSWYGNQTVPRTVVDINYIIKYASKKGNLTRLKPKRKFLSITDAVIVGEKEGPLCPSKKAIGYILISRDFIANDIVAALLARFSPKKIPSIVFSLNSQINSNNITNKDDIELISNNPDFSDMDSFIRNNSIKLEPSECWKNHIELTDYD